MSGIWEVSPGPSRRPEQQREFLVSVEVYISVTAAGALRKPPNQRRKNEKRDLFKSSEDGKKVKEKSSWMTLSRSSTGADHWRPATCKLLEEGDRCLLNIYIDETILYQTIYIHLLNHTDIRQTDDSLFSRKNSMGVYCAANQRWCSTHTAEPVFIQFASSDACNAWLALLRSYAIPEVYGRLYFATDGGSYRMWRQVEITVIQARNLGNTKPFVEGAAKAGTPHESGPESDAIDLDVSCEIYLNEILCGRTTVKKGIGSPDWHESFTFSDLPPFENLNVIVWREKKLFKPTALGSVRIALSNFRRGESIEGWFPVLHSGPVACDLQVGDIRLKIRVDEEIILPYSAYTGLLQVFNSRNFLDWMTDFESKLHLKTLSTQFLSIAVARNVLIEQVFELADREVDGTPSSHNTLFRGNTILTKIVELCMAFYGRNFLEASIGNVLRRLCAEKVSIEVDPVRSGKSTKDVERNVELLIFWCREFWKQIYSVRTECPHELRRLFQHIRTLVEKRYRIDDAHDQNRELPWQSVSAFCFLRFIVPAILHPHLFGLCPGLPGASVQRSLTLIAKVIQSLANLNATVQKEEFMRGVKDFLRESLPAMIDYILVVSTPSSGPFAAYPGVAGDRHDRLNIINALRQRSATMPVLDREAIPILPHLLDIPKHLAIITSAVIRSSRDYSSRPRGQSQGDRRLDNFYTKCFEVEEHALHRVSQLATRISSDKRTAPEEEAPRTPTSVTVTTLNSPSSPIPIPSSSHASTSKPSGGPRKTPRKLVRPSTAPSTSNVERLHSRELSPDDSSRISPASNTWSQVRTFTRDPEPETCLQTPPSPESRGRDESWSRRGHRLLHLRSSSSDFLESDRTPPLAEPVVDLDATSKRKRGLLRGILTRK